MTINERFKIIVNQLYFNNKRSFALAIGVNPTVVENIVGKRGGNPSFDVIYKVLFANANISPDWLILGTGSMLRSGTPQAPAAPAPQPPTAAPQPHSDSTMPYIMHRYEALIAENALLKQQVEQLKQSTTTPKPK